jgi:TonB family protein
LGAALGSSAIHLLGLLLLIRGEAPASARGPWQIAPPPQPEWIDVVSLDDPGPRPPPPVPVAPPPAPGPETIADQTRLPALALAPRIADGRQREAAAADAGERAGRTGDAAWRRDRSTLRASLSDGASQAQPPRSDTRAPAASLQAIRAEPVVGTGDALRTRIPAALPSALQPAVEEEAPAGEVARAAPGAPDHDRVVAAAELAAPEVAVQPARGVGPLEAERGPRSFDTQTPGPAADSRNQRAASNELHPGVTDLSRAGVRARDQALTGRGPGDAPGAVDHPSSGRAPAEYGGSRAQSVGAEVTERTRERAYDQYFREIQRRVGKPVFPRRLQLQLEQGETVVRFVVGADGRLRGGVRVSKSSGFDEFDTEATRAVERAAPFPPLPTALAGQPITVSMSFAFENPLIR